MKINNSKRQYYDIDLNKLPLLQYFDYGLWSETKITKFYIPKKSEHVSHSILNLQKTASSPTKTAYLLWFPHRSGYQTP